MATVQNRFARGLIHRHQESQKLLKLLPETHSLIPHIQERFWYERNLLADLDVPEEAYSISPATVAGEH